MPTASGFVRSAASGTKFTASFTIDDLLYTFAGSLTPSVQEFSCNNAELEYSSVGALTATRSFDGKIGSKDIRISAGNGPKITGTLDSPIHPASTVSGNGSWTQN